VPDEWIDRVFAVMARARHHTFQVLTKRPARMAAYLRAIDADKWQEFWRDRAPYREGNPKLGVQACEPQWPLPNVWLGTSVEDQATADARIPHLLATPAAVRFVSAEPLLGPVDFYQTSAAMPNADHPWRNGPILQGIHWLIVGGESGNGARPMHPDWARSLRDQCQAAGVPFFFKQWGEWEVSLDRGLDDPDWRADYSNNYVDRGKSRWLNLAGGRGFHGESFHVMRRVGKSRAGRLLDGRTWNQMPGDA
jgi:protein gp37